MKNSSQAKKNHIFARKKFMDNRLLISETRQYKVIFPTTLNDNETLFGGIAMQWMDEVAYITATRFVRKKMVTVAVKKVNFILPVKAGKIAEIIGKVINVGVAKIEILVEIYIEEMYSDKKEKAIDAIFVFAAINNFSKPIRIDC